jgi:hypothetical protein
LHATRGAPLECANARACCAHTTAQRAKRQHRRAGGSVGVGGASEHALPPASLLR